MAVEQRFNPPQVSKMLVKWSKCSSFYSQRTSKKKESDNQRQACFLSLSCRLFYLFSATSHKKGDDNFLVSGSSFLDKRNSFLDKPSNFQYNHPLRGAIF